MTPRSPDPPPPGASCSIVTACSGSVVLAAAFAGPTVCVMVMAVLVARHLVVAAVAVLCPLTLCSRCLSHLVALFLAVEPSACRSVDVALVAHVHLILSMFSLLALLLVIFSPLLLLVLSSSSNFDHIYVQTLTQPGVQHFLTRSVVTSTPVIVSSSCSLHLSFVLLRAE